MIIQQLISHLKKKYIKFVIICLKCYPGGHKLQLCRMTAAITVLFNNTYDGTEIVLIFMGSDNVAH